MPRISSRHHPFLSRCRRIAEGRGEDAEILLEGPHLLTEALAAQVPIEGVLTSGQHGAIEAEASRRGVPVLVAEPHVVGAASPVQHGAGIVAIARWQPAPAVDLFSSPGGVILALIDVQDPGNVGGMIRSADALGATAVLALDATARPGNWKALRAAMGSTFRLPVGVGTTGDLWEAQGSGRWPVVASVARGGVPLPQWTPPRACVLAVGNEGSGLPQPVVARADERVTIPMRHGIESLNVGVGAALMLWEIRRRASGGRHEAVDALR